MLHLLYSLLADCRDYLDPTILPFLAFPDEVLLRRVPAEDHLLQAALYGEQTVDLLPHMHVFMLKVRLSLSLSVPRLSFVCWCALN